MFKRYAEVLKEVKSLEVSLKDKIIYLCFSVLLSVLIVSGPICVFINLMIFRNIQKLLAFGIATMLILLMFFINYFYLKCVTNQKVQNIKVLYLTDAFIIAIVIYLLLIIIYFMGVL